MYRIINNVEVYTMLFVCYASILLSFNEFLYNFKSKKEMHSNRHLRNEMEESRSRETILCISVLIVPLAYTGKVAMALIAS